MLGVDYVIRPVQGSCCNIDRSMETIFENCLISSHLRNVFWAAIFYKHHDIDIIEGNYTSISYLFYKLSSSFSISFFTICLFFFFF